MSENNQIVGGILINFDYFSQVKLYYPTPPPLPPPTNAHKQKVGETELKFSH